MLARPLRSVVCVLTILFAIPLAAETTQLKLAVLEFESAKGTDVDRIYFSDKVRALSGKLAPHLFVMTRESSEMLLRSMGTSLEKCQTEGQLRD